MVVAFLLWFVFSADSIQVDPHTRYKIFDTSTGKQVTLQEISQAFKQANVLFFGEEHNDAVCHLVQDTLYKHLLAAYPKVALSMEMFETDVQLVVNEYLAGHITEAQLLREGRGWPNYKDYRPMVESAKAAQQPVIAANAARRYANMVSRNGVDALKTLSKESKKNIAKLPIDTVNAPYFDFFAGLMGGQQHMRNRNIYYAQSLWDATMAQSINTFWKKNKKAKVMHVNGRFHSDSKLGTVTQLQRMNKKIKVLTISTLPVTDFDTATVDAHKHLADFVILTDGNVPRSY